jgi:hypothetical protein
MYKLIKSTELETYENSIYYKTLKTYLTNQKLLSHNIIHTSKPTTMIFYGNENKDVRSIPVKVTGESKMKDLPLDKFFIVSILDSEQERIRLMILNRIANKESEFSDEEMHKISENLIYRYVEVEEFIEE